MHDYIINASTIRECNFAMGTIILGKGYAQALMHTVHSTHAFGTCAINSVFTCAWAKPFPKIVPMAKLDSDFLRKSWFPNSTQKEFPPNDRTYLT